MGRRVEDELDPEGRADPVSELLALLRDDEGAGEFGEEGGADDGTSEGTSAGAGVVSLGGGPTGVGGVVALLEGGTIGAATDGDAG